MTRWQRTAVLVFTACAAQSAPLARAWEPLPVAQDPLLRMPGSQPGQVTLEAPTRCLNCHDQYDPVVDPGFHWQGSMMSQAMRDPFFWAALTVAAQDSIWALGRPNATDLCLRCHSPSGWLGGRSDPTNGSMMTGADFDGVSCDGCHRMVDPFFEDTYAGTREGSDWIGYWDESGDGATPSTAAASVARDADRVESALLELWNGDPWYDPVTHRPVSTGWLEPGAGQYFMASASDKRASFADADPRHQIVYSRHHKSRFFCASCHDVSNPALQNLAFDGSTPGDGTTVLPTEQASAHSYFHVERTFSEFRLSDYGVGAGAPGSGFFTPATFETSRPGNLIAACQDCHMPDRGGPGCDKAGVIDRPTGSLEHPKSGQPLHDLTGGNALVPWILASTVVGSSNYDATNAALLGAGPATLTLDLGAGLGLNAPALLDGARRARENLEHAASIDALAYDAGTGSLSFRVTNHTGHKLPTGFPEGRRAFVNVRVWDGGAIVHELNPYDATAATLRGLPASYSPSSPALGAGQTFADALVYEVHPSSSLTAESHSFHFVLADGRYKDNRVPPRGFRIAEADDRESEPAWMGAVAPGYFSAAEYAGGYDAIQLSVPAGADGIEVRLYYQTTSREYVEFLRDEINGDADTLSSPTPSGEPSAYVVAGDPFFSGLAAWGTTIWDLFWHNRGVPGAAPIEMTRATFGSVGDPCSLPGSDGAACDDDDPCTTVDVCAAGTCSGSVLRVCAAAPSCRLPGVCNSSTGECDYAGRPEGTDCDDGDQCTTIDTCQSGSCTGASPFTCQPIDTCHGAGSCDPSTGACSTPSFRDGTPCGFGQCLAGVCLPYDAGLDAGVDAGMDAGIDAGADAGIDAGVDAVTDAGMDAGLDAGRDGGRAAVRDGGGAAGTGDAGADGSAGSSSTGGMDAATRDGSAPTDAATDAGEDAGQSGCSCRIARPAPAPVWLLVPLAVLAWRRARRRLRPGGGTWPTGSYLVSKSRRSS
jgi:hypothetical protein